MSSPATYVTEGSGCVAVSPTDQPAWSTHLGRVASRASRAALDVGCPAATPWSMLDRLAQSGVEEHAGVPTAKAARAAPARAIRIMVVGVGTGRNGSARTRACCGRR